MITMIAIIAKRKLSVRPNKKVSSAGGDLATKTLPDLFWEECARDHLVGGILMKEKVALLKMMISRILNILVMKVMMMMDMITITMMTKDSLDDVASRTVELASHLKKLILGFNIWLSLLLFEPRWLWRWWCYWNSYAQPLYSEEEANINIFQSSRIPFLFLFHHGLMNGQRLS